jgi:hypothetical protein
MFFGQELPVRRAARAMSPEGGTLPTGRFLPAIMRLLRRWCDRDRSSGAMLMAPDRDLGIPPWPRERQRSQLPVPREMWI